MKTILIALFLFIPFLLQAQQELPFITDRPTATASPVVIPINSFQIETGFSYAKTKYDSGGMNFENEDFSIANTLLRYGINSFLELRLGGQFSVIQSKADGQQSNAQGLNALMAGAKFQFAGVENSFVNAGILIEFALPFGNSAFRPEKIKPSIKLAASKSLFSAFSFGGNFGIQNGLLSNERTYVYSGMLGISVSEKTGAFAEVYGQTGKTVSPHNYIQCGFTYLHKKNIQIDFSVSKRMSGKVNELRGGVGLSVRLQ